MSQIADLQFLALLMMLGWAVVTDLRERRIPNKVVLVGLFSGIVLGAIVAGGFPLVALGGAGMALLIAFPFYALGGFGAGDAKLLTAVGAFVGIGGLLSVLVYAALAGGALALINATRRGEILGLLVNLKNLIYYWISRGRAGYRTDLNNPKAHSLPYGVAIAAGAVLAWFFPLSLVDLL